tara:strand:+ start:938 stop:1129 length:192 start_codon:yes stop_codon:yes gene_type:complete
MKIKNKTLQIRCDDELVTKLDMASREYLGSRSDLVRKILELWVLNTEEIRAELENDFAGETLG